VFDLLFVDDEFVLFCVLLIGTCMAKYVTEYADLHFLDVLQHGGTLEFVLTKNHVTAKVKKKTKK